MKSLPLALHGRSYRSHTDTEGHESRVVLQLVVLVQPTIRVERERIFPDRRVHVTLVDVWKNHGAF